MFLQFSLSTNDWCEQDLYITAVAEHCNGYA